ncbi:MAG: DUF2202 domain-containing protein [Desulfobacterales bacterium]
MKKTFLTVAALLSFTAFAFAGGDQNQNQYDGDLGQGPTYQERLDDPNKDALKVRQLTEEQAEIIYEIYEEEKLARDVYKTLGAIYPEENTFANIQLSEQAHMDAVRTLCDKYGIMITLSDDTGNFTIPKMEDFYDNVYQTFTVDRTGSLLDVLNVGIEIENMDIYDLGLALNGMPKDVVRVFNNLINGSLNHLEAFENAITRETSQ